MVGQFLAPFSCPKNLSYKYNATVQNDLQHNTLKSLRTEQQIVRLEKLKKTPAIGQRYRVKLSFKFFLIFVGVLVWTVKNCKADCISSRLAGYWEKFSISNNRASDNPHWLR